MYVYGPLSRPVPGRDDVCIRSLRGDYDKVVWVAGEYVPPDLESCFDCICDEFHQESSVGGEAYEQVRIGAEHRAAHFFHLRQAEESDVLSPECPSGFSPGLYLFGKLAEVGVQDLSVDPIAAAEVFGFFPAFVA